MYGQKRGGYSSVAFSKDVPNVILYDIGIKYENLLGIDPHLILEKKGPFGFSFWLLNFFLWLQSSIISFEEIQARGSTLFQYLKVIVFKLVRLLISSTFYGFFIHLAICLCFLVFDDLGRRDHEPMIHLPLI